jgi:hypothetical protein
MTASVRRAGACRTLLWRHAAGKTYPESFFLMQVKVERPDQAHSWAKPVLTGEFA